MKRKITVLALSAVLFALCVPVEAQQGKKVARLGFLGLFTPELAAPSVAAVREGLRARGYVDGKNIQIDTQSLVDRYHRLAEAADKLGRVNTNQ